MNIVIVGCGRVGSKLAAHYSSEGHRVSVIDEQEEAVANLGPRLAGGLSITAPASTWRC